MDRVNGQIRESSVSSQDSEEAFEQWMESRPRPDVTIPDEVLLFQTLKTVSASPLRDALTRICQQIPSAREMAIKELLIYKDELLEEDLCEPNPAEYDYLVKSYTGPKSYRC